MKRKRKTIEWERLEISSRKLEIPREQFFPQGNISCKDEHNKGQKRYGPNRSRDTKRWQEYTELHKKDLYDQIIMMVGSLVCKARHPRMRSQVGLRKHHYEQS